MLYFDGCPHWRTAADRLAALQAELGFELTSQRVATPEEAESAISKLNGTSFDGRTIQVEKAKAPGSGGGSRGGGGGRGGFGGGGGGGGGGRGGSRGGRW